MMAMPIVPVPEKAVIMVVIMVMDNSPTHESANTKTQKKLGFFNVRIFSHDRGLDTVDGAG